MFLFKVFNHTDSQLIWPNEKLKLGAASNSNWSEFKPLDGMVGYVVHYWQANHGDDTFRSTTNRTILLVRIGEKYVTIHEEGVKEYNTTATITLTTTTIIPKIG